MVRTALLPRTLEYEFEFRGCGFTVERVVTAAHEQVEKSK